MAVQLATITTEEFIEFVNRPENADRDFELIHGEIVEMPSPSLLHNLVAAKVLHFLMTHLDHHAVGYVVGDANDFDLSPHDTLRPDAAFIAKEKIQGKFPKRCAFAPDLAVEILSPSNTEQDMLDKIETYIRYRTRMVWVGDPDEQAFRVYRPGENGRITFYKVTADEMLDGEDILPGFKVLVRDLFPVVEAEEEPAPGSDE